MTLPLPFGDPVIDPAAAAQQLAAVACVYQNAFDDLDELFAPARVVHFIFRPESWPPSYALIQWEEDQWLVVLAGTTNFLPQVPGHIQGSFGMPTDRDPITVNGQWGVVWEDLRAAINASIGVLPPTGRIYLSGHSYGGAVAAIGAVDYAGRYGVDRVSLMTFAAPKSFTTDHPADLPRVWHRVESTWDAVPTLPPTIDGVYVVEHWANPLYWLPRFPTWVHYGQGWILSPNGQWNYPGPDPDPLPPGVTTLPIGAHRIRNYWGRLNARYQADGGVPAYEQALVICDRVLLREPQQTTAPALPRVVTGPDGTPVEVPGYDGIPPSPSLTVRSTMPLATDLLPPPYFKLTQFFNWGDAGWDESYYCSTTGGDNPMLNVVNAGIELARIRKKALYTGASYVGLRVSEVAKPHRATPDKEAQTGPGGLVGDPLPTGSCVYIRMQDRTFLYDSEKIYRGITRQWLGTDNVNATKITPTAAMQNWLQQMTNFLRAPYPGTPANGGGEVKFGIAAADRETAGLEYVVTKVAINNDGFIDITALGSPVSIAEKDMVHLSVQRIRCARGLSGRWRVRSVAGSPGGAILTLNKKFCCAANDLVTLMGTVRRIQSTMAQVYWFEFSKAGHRNTGRPNFCGAGRRSGGCC